MLYLILRGVFWSVVATVGTIGGTYYTVLHVGHAFQIDAETIVILMISLGFAMYAIIHTLWWKKIITYFAPRGKIDVFWPGAHFLLWMFGLLNFLYMPELVIVGLSFTSCLTGAFYSISQYELQRVDAFFGGKRHG